jgi:hypothetical protein
MQEREWESSPYERFTKKKEEKFILDEFISFNITLALRFNNVKHLYNKSNIYSFDVTYAAQVIIAQFFQYRMETIYTVGFRYDRWFVC